MTWSAQTTIPPYRLYIHIYISEHKQNAHNDGNRAQPLKRLFETLFLAMKKCTGFTTDVYVVLYTKCICILHVNKVPYTLFLISSLISSDEKTRGGYSVRSLFE